MAFILLQVGSTGGFRCRRLEGCGLGYGMLFLLRYILRCFARDMERRLSGGIVIPLKAPGFLCYMGWGRKAPDFLAFEGKHAPLSFAKGSFKIYAFLSERAVKLRAEIASVKKIYYPLWLSRPAGRIRFCRPT